MARAPNVGEIYDLYVAKSARSGVIAPIKERHHLGAGVKHHGKIISRASKRARKLRTSMALSCALRVCICWRKPQRCSRISIAEK